MRDGVLHVTALLWALCHGMAWAQAEPPDAAPPWRLSGFATVGLNHLDGPEGWRFVRDINQPRAGDATDVSSDARLGLQVNGALAPGLDAAVQLVLKRVAGNETLGNRIEQAYLAWQPRDGFMWRMGRFAADVFLLADYRNVGFSYPWVRPDVDFYGWIPSTALDGVDTHYQWLTDDDVQWKVRAWSGQWRGALGGYVARYPTHHRQTSLGVTRQSGALTLKATYAHVVNTIDDLTNPFDPAQLGAAMDVVAGLPVSPEVAAEAAGLRRDLPQRQSSFRYYGLALLYEGPPWLVHAEASYTPSSMVNMGGMRGYASLGWRQGDFTWFGKAGFSRPLDRLRTADAPRWQAELTPVVGTQAAGELTQAAQISAGVINALRFDQRTLSLGVRWDLDSQTALKLQVDRMHTAAYGAAGWDQLTDRPGRSTLWSITVDKVF